MKKYTKVALAALATALIVPMITNAQSLGNRLKGKLLLQVEQGGRIWYVSPSDEKRYEVRFDNALDIFEEQALGITDDNLNKIPIAAESLSYDVDSDGDGNSDRKEAENGYDPYGTGSMSRDTAFGKRFSGKLMLQVQQSGRIWYIDFDGYRWEVTWKNLMNLFRKLSLGIANKDLNSIPSGQAGDGNEASSPVASSPAPTNTAPVSQPTQPSPVASQPAPAAPAQVSSTEALGLLLNKNTALTPTEIVTYYRLLNQRDRNWLDIETKFTQFMQLVACQEHLDFVTYDYSKTAYSCTDVAQSIQQSLQYITQEQLVQNADASRMAILNGYNCETGATDASVCNQYFGTLGDFQAGDRQTFQSINDNISGACTIGTDPNCR
jgi:hypothetical protein